MVCLAPFTRAHLLWKECGLDTPDCQDKHEIRKAVIFFGGVGGGEGRQFLPSLYCGGLGVMKLCHQCGPRSLDRQNQSHRQTSVLAISHPYHDHPSTPLTNEVVSDLHLDPCSHYFE